MEDAHATILDLDEEGLPDKNAFFAVYDGHGGACARLAVYSTSSCYVQARPLPALLDEMYTSALQPSGRIMKNIMMQR
jgi:serine/threonine protein phosphatase PrpC